MTDSLSGKVAAVTGAASGIGLACAARHARGRRPRRAGRPRRGPAAIACAPNSAQDAFPVVIDLLDPSSVTRMMPAILEKAGQLDIFHANAGAYVGGEVVEGDPDAWDRMLNLNINAVLPHDPRGSAAHGRAQDRRHHRHQLGRGLRAGGLGADLHGVEVRGAGLRPHGPPPGHQARHPRRRGRARAGRDRAPRATGRRPRWTRRSRPAA